MSLWLVVVVKMITIHTHKSKGLFVCSDGIGFYFKNQESHFILDLNCDESLMTAVRIPHKELFMQDSQETSEGDRGTEGGDEYHFPFLTLSLSLHFLPSEFDIGLYLRSRKWWNTKF
jgi:hypothetical protein